MGVSGSFPRPNLQPFSLKPARSGCTVRAVPGQESPKKLEEELDVSTND